MTSGIQKPVKMYYVKCFPSKSILAQLFFLDEYNLYALNFFLKKEVLITLCLGQC